jgi:ATP-binding cassette subfamily B protein RaxB
MIARLPITRIVIAHRPALVERADLVFRLAEGKLLRVEKNALSRPTPPATRPGLRSIPSF